MGKITDVIGGIGILIGIYLFLRHGDQTVKIIVAMAENSISGIKALQGR